jgi:hypothetical protein
MVQNPASMSFLDYNNVLGARTPFSNQPPLFATNPTNICTTKITISPPTSRSDYDFETAWELKQMPPLRRSLAVKELADAVDWDGTLRPYNPENGISKRVNVFNRKLKLRRLRLTKEDQSVVGPAFPLQVSRATTIKYWNRKAKNAQASNGKNQCLGKKKQHKKSKSQASISNFSSANTAGSPEYWSIPVVPCYSTSRQMELVQALLDLHMEEKEEKARLQ